MKFKLILVKNNGNILSLFIRFFVKKKEKKINIFLMIFLKNWHAYNKERNLDEGYRY